MERVRAPPPSSPSKAWVLLAPAPCQTLPGRPDGVSDMGIDYLKTLPESDLPGASTGPSDHSDRADIKAVADSGGELGDDAKPVAADEGVSPLDRTLPHEAHPFDRKRGDAWRKSE